MITTNDQKPSPHQVEPRKLNHITTAIIPAVTEPKDGWPTPKGDGFAKMITTHDEPRPESDKKGPGRPKGSK